MFTDSVFSLHALMPHAVEVMNTVMSTVLAIEEECSCLLLSNSPHKLRGSEGNE